MNKPENNFRIPFSVSDYEDESYYSLLRNLPSELAKNHMHYVESQSMSDDEIINYLNEIINSRRETTTSSEISDLNVKELFSGEEDRLFKSLETTVFNDPTNYLGMGMTARVKLFEAHRSLNGEDTHLKMAIKYVLTPTEKTLTAEQEHGVIKEVERMRMIESAELAYPNRSKYIRVPHPFLYHSNYSIQLFGMECVDGITLEQASREGMLHEEFKTALRNTPLVKLPKAELDGYIERFFDTMHQYCLHGDIKPRNIMVSRDGVIYIIDFGQSVMMHNMPNKSEAAVENIKTDEIEHTKIAVHSLIRKVLED